MRRARGRSLLRTNKPKRDVTWGFRSFGFNTGGESSFSQWIAAPSRAIPDPDNIVPQLPADVTLIRALPIYSAFLTIANTSPFSRWYAGLIAWGGVDAGDPPGEFPDAADGAWDWIWRVPIMGTPPTGTGATIQNNTLGAPVWTDIHSQRKFGTTLGLLFVWSGTEAQIADVINFQFDLRYAVKLPW